MNHWKSWKKTLVTLTLALGTTAPLPALADSTDPVDAVNPFVGTAAHGHTYPGATVPFGMVQLSPDTYSEEREWSQNDWDWCSGYHWSDSSLAGFSHTHLSGTGCADLGDVLFAPTVGDVVLAPGTKEHPETGYRSRFSHSDEKASPGYYCVNLRDKGILAELTTTKRVGLHRYKFPATKQANIVVDLAHGIGDKPLATELTIMDDHTIAGMRRSKGWAQNQQVFFMAEFSKPFASYGTALDEALPEPGSKHAIGGRVKGWLTFDTTDGAPVIAKVALSTTSVEGAMRNLKAEAPGWDFDSVAKQARTAWEQELSKVKIQGGSQDDQKTFYTALYHSMLAPTLISDVDGQYRGADDKVHTAKGFDNYSTFSLWDTFRAEHPLFTALEPSRVNDMVKAIQVQGEYHKDKTLPIWPLSSNETYCMIGYHSFPVIAEAYIKGYRNWDANALYNMMVENTKQNDWWAAKGYIPADKKTQSVSRTLEFAYDDWALAQFAKALGKQADYNKYMQRAAAYKNVFDPQTGFMRGRLDNGSWRTPFDPAAIPVPGTHHDFTEGNAWQYSWFVPQDVAGLIALMGGNEAFTQKLDALFEHPPVEKPAGSDEDVSGLIGQYAHGNEPSHHIAYLYSYAGEPWKTADRVVQVRDRLYSDKADGLCGNEDCGQMSAWYVFSALGFYPVNPVQATYVFGTPEFPQTEISLPNGKALTVVAHNLSPTSHYIQKVVLNGKALARVYLTHEELVRGGKLEFVMSDKPDKTWGTTAQAAPPSMSLPLTTALK